MGSHGAHSHDRHGVMSGLVVAPYDLVAGLLMRSTYAAVAELIAVRAPTDGTVVDIGTGPGHLPEALSRRRPDLTVIGVDPSADMLARARRRAGGPARMRLIEAGSEDLPLADASVDAVVSTLSAHHWADPAAALAEQARVLRPGGRFWLVDLRREIDHGLLASVVRAGFTLLDEPQPRLRIRRLAAIAALRRG